MAKDITCPECEAEDAIYEEVAAYYRPYNDNGTLERGGFLAEETTGLRCEECLAEFSWGELWDIVKNTSE